MALENKKQLFIIVAAVAAGIVATVLTSHYVQTKISAETQALSEQYDAKQRELKAQLQQESDQKLAAVAQEIERVKNEQAQMVQRQIEEMKALQAQQIAAEQNKKKHKPSLAVRTPPGKRAVTVMIDSLAAVGGLINAGDFVDVIAHLDLPEGVGDKKKNVTAMIFQGLQVLAVNTNLDEPGAYDEQQILPSLKITFAVDPQESGLLSFADKNGNLELALRAPDEQDHQMVKASTWKTLADYVLENQGANIKSPDGEDDEGDPVDNKPNIQIFRGGKEL